MTELIEQQSEFARLQDALASGLFAHVRNMAKKLSPSDLAHILESTPPRARDVLWQLIEEEQRGEILQYLGEDIRNVFLHRMDPQEVALAMAGLDTDDLADILGDLPDSLYREVLLSMDKQDRKRVEAVLSYPENTAGGLMNTDTVTVRPDVTLDVVIRYLRRRGELPETTDSLYVVNRQDRFVGLIPLAMLLTHKPSAVVSHVMVTDVNGIPADMADSQVAQLFERRDLVSAPVVDHEGKLLGRITIDDVVDVIRDEADHSVMGMVGLEEDTFAPVMGATKRRAIWLGINLITVLIASSVIGLFEHTIQKVLALAILQPIVPSMAGVAGTQTLTLVIRGLALGHVSDRNRRWLLWKELTIGLLNGMLWAVVVAVVAALWFDDVMLGGVIGGAMILTLMAGTLAGAWLPILLRRLGIDPVLSGGVILTTVTDVTGFFTFLGLATLFFR